MEEGWRGGKKRNEKRERGVGGREERRRMGWLRERKENEKGKGCRGGGGITNISFVASCTLLRCVGQSECNKSEWNIRFILFTLPT